MLEHGHAVPGADVPSTAVPVARQPLLRPVFRGVSLSGLLGLERLLRGLTLGIFAWDVQRTRGGERERDGERERERETERETERDRERERERVFSLVSLA